MRGFIILLIAILAASVACEAVLPRGLTPALSILFTMALISNAWAFIVAKETPAAPVQPLDTAPLMAKLDEQNQAIAVVQQALSFIIDKTKLNQLP